MSESMTKTLRVCGAIRDVGIFLNYPDPADAFIPKEDASNILVTWEISGDEASATRSKDLLRYYLIPKNLNLNSAQIRQEFRITKLPNREEEKGEEEFRFEWEIHLSHKAINGKILYQALVKNLFS